jgi:ATP-dependent RNA helicase RhlE
MSFRPRRRRTGRATQNSPAQASPRHAPPQVAAPTLAPSPPLTPEREALIAASPFTALGLVAPLARAVLDEGYTTPSPVQAAVIPHGVTGRDVVACAQTGTGKTAGFVLPMLQRLLASPRPSTRPIRALILTPTRELAIQIAERITAYGRHLQLEHALVYGGVSQHRQEIALRRAPDVLVATPGRLLDLMSQRIVDLSKVEHFVLDEADRMLDMGFIHDVRRVVATLPTSRQTLFFSATMPPAVEALARGMLRDPARVSIAPKVTTAEGVEQSVVFVAREEKKNLLVEMLLRPGIERAIVFTRTKHGANRLADQLGRAGITAAAIHGNKSQGARERALDGFRRGTTPVLVATDLAARGIDVEGISLVVNYDLPEVAESYVHRIGRTGRAGATGRAVSFCDKEERPLLLDIERFIKKRLPVATRPAAPAAAESSAAL